jgi:thiamine-monophosphate kinase
MLETKIIHHHFKKLSKTQTFLNDGCEISIPESKKLVITKDILISNMHFFRNDPANFIAQKALNKNLSDLASMGAKPYGYLMGISLPKNIDENFIENFCDGLKKIQNLYNLDLFGGDTNFNSNDMILISITMFGLANKNQSLMQHDQAKIGEKIYISGELGNAYLGYLILSGKLNLEKKQYQEFIDRYLTFQCKVDLGLKLHDKASSCTDISDSFNECLMKICNASNLSAQIDVKKIPINDKIKNLIEKNIIKMDEILSWGDDYELLFFGDKENFHDFNNEIFEIGEMIESKSNENCELVFTSISSA